jgi:hypothetical protein
MIGKKMKLGGLMNVGTFINNQLSTTKFLTLIFNRMLT